MSGLLQSPDQYAATDNGVVWLARSSDSTSELWTLRNDVFEPVADVPAPGPLQIFSYENQIYAASNNNIYLYSSEEWQSVIDFPAGYAVGAAIYDGEFFHVFDSEGGQVLTFEPETSALVASVPLSVLQFVRPSYQLQVDSLGRLFLTVSSSPSGALYLIGNNAIKVLSDFARCSSRYKWQSLVWKIIYFPIPWFFNRYVPRRVVPKSKLRSEPR